MTGTRVPTIKCPECGEKLTGVDVPPGTPSALPTVGDVTVCIYCALLLRFGKGLKLRRLRRSDIDELELDDPDTMVQARRMQEAVRVFKARH